MEFIIDSKKYKPEIVNLLLGILIVVSIYFGFFNWFTNLFGVESSTDWTFFWIYGCFLIFMGITGMRFAGMDWIRAKKSPAPKEAEG